MLLNMNSKNIKKGSYNTGDNFMLLNMNCKNTVISVRMVTCFDQSSVICDQSVFVPLRHIPYYYYNN
jgi:hypothetical protein